MTEDEAKTKWCPFARCGSSTSGLGSMNRVVEIDGLEQVRINNECIASTCMAWREQKVDRWVDSVGVMIEDGQRGSYQGAALKTIIVGGYCGLAGAPQ